MRSKYFVVLYCFEAEGNFENLLSSISLLKTQIHRILMAPKKKADEAERPPEGEDERQVTIALAGKSSAAIHFTLLIPGEEPIVSEPVGPGTFSSPLFSKRIQISPVTVDAFVAGIMTIVVSLAPEQKDVTSSKVVKGSTKAPTKSKEQTAEVGIDEANKVGTFAFNLVDLLQSKETSINLLQHSRAANTVIERLSANCSSSDVLLSANNIAKYFPIIIGIQSVANLAPATSLALNHTMEVTAPYDLKGHFDDVFVRCTFLKDEVITPKLKHAPSVDFQFRKAVIGCKMKKYELIEALFFTPIMFEVHDRDSKIAKCSPCGVAHVSLREALGGQMLFDTVSQVVPFREQAEGLTGSEYISYGTTLETKVEFLAPLPKAIYEEKRKPKAVF